MCYPYFSTCTTSVLPKIMRKAGYFVWSVVLHLSCWFWIGVLSGWPRCFWRACRSERIRIDWSLGCLCGWWLCLCARPSTRCCQVIWNRWVNSLLLICIGIIILLLYFSLKFLNFSADLVVETDYLLVSAIELFLKLIVSLLEFVDFLNE